MFFFKHKPCFTPWNKGKIIGQKPPLKIQEVQAIRSNLEKAQNIRHLALFNLAIDSKLRSCDLVKLRVRDVARGSEILSRTKVLQQKTKQMVQFEITTKTRQALRTWISYSGLSMNDYIFRKQTDPEKHMTTRTYARTVKCWVSDIGLNKADYGTHSLRRTKATYIYKQTKDIRAIQLLLGHKKIENTVRYLGVDVDDALELSEQIEI